MIPPRNVSGEPLSRAIMDITARMMSSRLTGREAVAERMRRATSAELISWGRDPMLQENGLDMWRDAIADEMQRRIDEAPPLVVNVVDYGAKR